jgi:hypothetical protein
MATSNSINYFTMATSIVVVREHALEHDKRITLVPKIATKISLENGTNNKKTNSVPKITTKCVPRVSTCDVGMSKRWADRQTL